VIVMAYPDLQIVLSFRGVLELRDSEELVRVRLCARSLDPLAVRLGVDSEDGSANWVFARDLLVRGLHSTAGEGSVRVRPCPHASRRSMLEIILDGGTGFARLLIPKGSVTHFLDASDAFTYGELSDEILSKDLTDELADILASEADQDPLAE
jgi:hypothetical protein